MLLHPHNPDNIYYDLSIKNYSVNTEINNPLRFYETRQSNIIDDCSQIRCQLFGLISIQHHCQFIVQILNQVQHKLIQI